MSTDRALQNDFQQATGVNGFDQTIRNGLDEFVLRARHPLALCSLPGTELQWHLR